MDGPRRFLTVPRSTTQLSYHNHERKGTVILSTRTSETAAEAKVKITHTHKCSIKQVCCTCILSRLKAIQCTVYKTPSMVPKVRMEGNSHRSARQPKTAASATTLFMCMHPIEAHEHAALSTRTLFVSI